jgi:hypothetical protein
MPEAFTASPSAISIHRPDCPKCGTRMSLARICPAPGGYDHRTFECAKCEHVHKETVCTDPMKSDKAGWLDGELKTPKIAVLSRNKLWTDAEDERLRAFVAQGASVIKAAAALRRTTASVRARSRGLGCPFPPLRIARQKWADQKSPE